MREAQDRPRTDWLTQCYTCRKPGAQPWCRTSTHTACTHSLLPTHPCLPSALPPLEGPTLLSHLSTTQAALPLKVV